MSSKSERPGLLGADGQWDPVAAFDLIRSSSPPECAFTATGERDARDWQKWTRKRLRETIGFQDQRKVDLNPRLVREVQREGYVRREYIITTSQNIDAPVHVLVPDGVKSPQPTVLALHGHAYGVGDIVGLWEDGRERLDPDGYQVDFACTLAQRGFVVVAPEIVGFGQRISRECSENKGFYPCWHLAPFALMMGGSVVGMRTWDAMRAIDFAQTLPEVDRNRIGAMGISGGGMNTFFATALDDRIKACVISGYFCDWRYGLLGKFHCFCNFVPGLLRLGELNDLAGLIAPRPCLVEAGSRDQYFPYQPSLDTVDRARRCWQAFGQESLLELDAFDGRHRISGRRAYDFLKEHV